ncbi:MAG: helix-turn-helix transcriptional regulator [Rhodocyclales bacterium RIFCSPLOWO2_02_FULL_63_24]|nr:MAG: helix-turn-helix transcriptional regulator [Rhodocyclales bacterium RIFCSPLOWO2_02_FULL_63_24]
MTPSPGQLLSQDDLALAFDLAPVGLCVSRERVIQRCNEALASMFGFGVAELAGQSLACLYPSSREFENIGARGWAAMRETGGYSDERIMRHRSGRLFWCHVAGRSLDRNDPFACAVWMFEDISAKRPVQADLTAREREIVQFLATGETSKQIARRLDISPRTVEAHRARMIKKLGANSAGELISRLVGVI